MEPQKRYKKSILLKFVHSEARFLRITRFFFVMFFFVVVCVSKLIYQRKANPFSQMRVYLYRSKTAFNSQSSILWMSKRRRERERGRNLVRNQSSVHIWTVWKWKSKLNKRIFPGIWLNYLDYASDRIKWIDFLKFSLMTFYLLLLLIQVLFFLLVTSFKSTRTHSYSL